jgi:hypothetical protein
MNPEEAAVAAVFAADDAPALPTEPFVVPRVVSAVPRRRELQLFALAQPVTSKVDGMAPAPTATMTSLDSAPLWDAYFTASQEEGPLENRSSVLVKSVIPTGQSFLAAATLAFLFHGVRVDRSEQDRKRNVTLWRE